MFGSAPWLGGAAQTRPSIAGRDAERWGGILAGAGLALFGLTRRSRTGLAFAAAGGGLIASALVRTTQRAAPDGGRIEVERTVTINRPAEELYRYWRDLANLPRIMQHLESVTPLDERRSHWVAKGPLGRTVEWDAEIVEERPNELIAWRSLPGASVPNTGAVRFAPAPGDRGTEVKVTLAYDPPAGPAGAAAAKLLMEEPDQQVREDLRRFKAVMEAGEAPSTDGQPSGRDDED